MAAIEPSQKRSADVVAHDTVVALKLTSAQFMAVGRSYPQMWLPIARELSRRLFERNELIPAPNEYPKLFVISSKEALEIARTIRSSLENDVFSTVWHRGVFFAGGIRWRHSSRPSANQILPSHSPSRTTSSRVGAFGNQHSVTMYYSNSASSWESWVGTEIINPSKGW
jgi:hypothetical protein